MKKVGRLKEVWSYDLKEDILVSPVFFEYSDEHLIVNVTKEGDIFLLTSEGELKWKFDLKTELSKIDQLFLDKETMNAVYSIPVCKDINSDGKPEIIFGTERGDLFVVSVEGNLLWKFKSGAPIRGSVVVNKDNIIFGSMDKNIYCLNSKGELVWKWESSDLIESNLLIYEDRIYFGCNDGLLYCLDNLGQLVWKFESSSKITAKPVAADLYGNGEMRLIFGNFNGDVYSINMYGELDWSYPVGSKIFSEVCVKDVNEDGCLEIFFGAFDNNVYSLSCHGDKIWSYQTDFWVVNSVSVLDIDKDGLYEVVVGSYDNKIYVLDAKGEFALDYVPGLSTIVFQPGHYTDLITDDPGKFIGKSIWEYALKGMVVGLDVYNDEIIAATKTGIVSKLWVR